jgi:hypothetical protein
MRDPKSPFLNAHLENPDGLCRCHRVAIAWQLASNCKVWSAGPSKACTLSSVPSLIIGTDPKRSA